MKVIHNGHSLHLKQQLEQHLDSRGESHKAQANLNSTSQRRCPAYLDDIVQPLLNHCSDGLIVMDKSGELVWYSDHLASLFALSSDVAFEQLLSSLPAR